jgi:hypothetical protein
MERPRDRPYIDMLQALTPTPSLSPPLPLSLSLSLFLSLSPFVPHSPLCSTSLPPLLSLLFVSLSLTLFSPLSLSIPPLYLPLYPPFLSFSLYPMLSLQESFPDCKGNEFSNLIKCLNKGINWIKLNDLAVNSLTPNTQEYTRKNKAFNYTCSENLTLVEQDLL